MSVKVYSRRKAMMDKVIVPVEYIASASTQWVHVPVSVDITKLEIKFQFLINTSQQRVVSTTNGGASFNIYVNAQGRIASSINMDWKASGLSWNVLSVAKIDGNLKRTTINNSNINHRVQPRYGKDLYLFAAGVNNACSTSKIYYCKIYNDNTVLADLIPVRVGNVGYMYDKVSGKLFGNSGTGSFVLGPDK